MDASLNPNITISIVMLINGADYITRDLFLHSSAMIYVYILYSQKHDKYYTGSSQNPWERLKQHNNVPFNTFTAKYRPWELAAVFEAGKERKVAEAFEKYIKKQKSRALLVKLIEPGFVPFGELAPLVRGPWFEPKKGVLNRKT